jgi:hypothetical protein
MQLDLNDAQSVVSFVTRQAAHIEATVYKTKYPDLQYADLIPIDTSAGEYAKTIEFYSSDMVGKAQWFNHNSRDVPRADVLMNKHTHGIEMAAIGYGYTTEEIGYASRLGVNLGGDRAAAARRAYEEFVNDIAFQGDAQKGWTGLFNDAGVNAANVPADGTGSSRLWSAKTPIQILRDINEALTAVVTGTRRTEIAGHLLLPLEAFVHITTTPMSTDMPNQTIYDYIMKSNTFTAMTGQPLTIRVGDGLETAGAGGTGRMIAYRKADDVLKLHLPVPLKFLPVWRTGPMLYEIPGYFKLGGVEIRLPGAVKYRDGIC